VAKKNVESKAKSLRLNSLPVNYCSTKINSRNLGAKSQIPIDLVGRGGEEEEEGATNEIESFPNRKLEFDR
jgi:hypothetical protein